MSVAEPLDPKEIVTVQELAISNMLQIEVLIKLLVEKEIIDKGGLMAKTKRLDKEMKEGKAFFQNS